MSVTTHQQDANPRDVRGTKVKKLTGGWLAPLALKAGVRGCNPLKQKKIDILNFKKPHF